MHPGILAVYGLRDSRDLTFFGYFCAINATTVEATLDGTPDAAKAALAASYAVTVADVAVEVTAVAYDEATKKATLTVALDGKEGALKVNGVGTATIDFVDPTATVTVQDSTHVILNFSEKVKEATVEDVSAYTQNLGLSVTSATLGEDGKQVTLVTSVQNPAVTYNIKLTDAEDLAGNKAEVAISFKGASNLYVVVDDITAADGDVLYDSDADVAQGVTDLRAGAITIDFNEDVVAGDDATINVNNIKLIDITNGATVLPVAVARSANNIDVTPSVALENNHTYKLTISGVSVGGTVIADKEYTFKVGTPVAVVATDIADNQPVTVGADVLKKKFNGVLDAATVNATTVKVMEYDTDEAEVIEGTEVAGTPAWDLASRTVSFQPAAQLVGGKTYAFIIDGVANAAGIKSAALEDTFTVDAKVVPGFVKATIAKDNSTQVDLTNGMVDVALAGDADTANNDILVYFDKELAAVPENAVIELLDETDVEIIAVTTAVDNSVAIPGSDPAANYGILKIGYGGAINAKLTSNHKYKLSISGLISNDANETPIQAFNLGFTAENAAPKLVSISSDDDATGLDDTALTSGDVNVKAGTDVVILFDKALNKAADTVAVDGNDASSFVELYKAVMGADGKTLGAYQAVPLASVNTQFETVDAVVKAIRIDESIFSDTQKAKYKLVLKNTIIDTENHAFEADKVQPFYFTNGFANGNAATLIAGNTAIEYKSGGAEADLGDDELTLDLDSSFTVTLDTSSDDGTTDKTILDKASVTAETFYLMKTATEEKVAATITVSGNEIKLQPTQNLEQFTGYTLVIDGVKDTLGNEADKISQDFRTIAVVEVTAGVTEGATITEDKVTLTFNRDMNTSTLDGATNTSNLTLYRGSGEVRLYEVDTTKTGDAALSAVDLTDDVAYNINTKELVISGLEQNKTYAVELMQSVVADQQGNTLASDVSKDTKALVTFKTAKDTVAPVYQTTSDNVDPSAEGAKAINNAYSVAQDEVIYVVYNEALEAANDKEATVAVYNTKSQTTLDLSAAQAGFIDVDAAVGSQKVIKIDFAEIDAAGGVLAADTTYKVTISGVKDTTGNATSPVVLTFTTGPAPTIEQSDAAVATVDPTIKAANDDSSFDVAVGSDNTIYLVDAAAGDNKEALLGSSVVASNIKFYANNAEVSLGHSVTLTADGKTAIVEIPKNTMAKDTVYTMVVTGVKDLAGNPMDNTDGKLEVKFSTEKDVLVQTPAKIKVFAGDTEIADQTTNVAEAKYDAGITIDFDGDLDLEATNNKTTLLSMIEIKDITDSSDVKTLNIMTGDLTIQKLDSSGTQKDSVVIAAGTSFFAAGNTYTITLKAGTLKAADGKTVTINADKKITVRVSA